MEELASWKQSLLNDAMIFTGFMEMSSNFQEARMTETLFAGVSRRIINARPGSPKFGIRLFADPIQGYESDLTATALVLANSQTKLAIIALDICELFNPLADQIRQEAADRLGVPRSHVMINLSHDHSTPAPPNSTRDSAERKRFSEVFGEELKKAYPGCSCRGQPDDATGAHWRWCW